jgi:murein DD-endopeptidase MepM/ murein hydrolase activator NlpD
VGSLASSSGDQKKIGDFSLSIDLCLKLFEYRFCFIFVFVFLSACSTLEQRQPPWRKEIPSDSENFFEGEDFDGDTLPRYPGEVLSKLPPVQLNWPLERPEITNYFGWRKKRMHDGVDLRAPVGTPIFSAAKGRVIYASSKMRGYGKLIIVDHGEGWSTLYAHLSKIQVKVGQTVKALDQIGLSGKTGRTRGPHLHFELRRGADPVDPVLFFPDL